MAAHRVEAERRIGDRPRDHSTGGETRPVLTQDRAAGDPPARWLQADHAAARGRDADRTTTVAAVAQRAEAGGDRRSSTAAGTAGGPGLIDRISGGREHRSLGNRAGAKLGGIRLSQNSGALVLQPANGEAVELRDRFLEDRRPEAVAISGERGCFLDRDGNALEQTQRFAARDPLFGSRRLALGQLPRQ